MFQTNLVDDINISYSSKKYEISENIINKELHLIYDWLCTTNLSINLSKTNFIVFSKSKIPHIPRIHINNHQVEIIDYVIFFSYRHSFDLEETYKPYFNQIKILYMCLFLPASLQCLFILQKKVITIIAHRVHLFHTN